MYLTCSTVRTVRTVLTVRTQERSFGHGTKEVVRLLIGFHGMIYLSDMIITKAFMIWFIYASSHAAFIKPSSSRQLQQQSKFTQSRFWERGYYIDPISDSDINTGDPIDQLSYGEKSRLYRRTVFTAEDWIKHRAPERFFRNLSTIFTSGILVSLIDQILVITLVALMTVIWNCFAVEGWTDFHGYAPCWFIRP
jgi:hypothetical protein